ncbi:Uma2 family endonuclease [Prochlorothrix hollandica]|uniref:Uma2 family endonuclease n=1 Tax=Prochlorothrix hollandica TaxID=1223 RepID=UPI0033416C07
MSAITAQELEAQMPDATQLYSDEPEMESSLHYTQLMMLVTCLEFAWRDRQDFFIGANLTIYFSRQQLKNRDFRGPDFFLVKNTERNDRKSWVVWEEDGRYPDLIIELLSTSTATIDRTLKRDLYAQRFHTPEYFYFSPDTLEFAGFKLEVNHYQPIVANDKGWLWSEGLGLFLGLHGQELRYFSIEGSLLPTPQEAFKLEVERGQLLYEQERQRAEEAQRDAEQERQRAEEAQRDAEQERQRAERSEERLKALEERMRSLGFGSDLRE